MFGFLWYYPMCIINPLLPRFSVQSKQNIYKNMISVQQQREQHH